MKKITLLGVFLIAVSGFAQTGKQKIQAYFENNRSKYALTSQDIADLDIRSEFYGNGTKVTTYRVVQRYQGTEVFHAESSVTIKGDEIFRVENGFTTKIADKVNAVTPTLSVTDAIASAYSKLGITASTHFSIVETKSAKSFSLSDGVQEDHILAKLVYQTMPDNALKLAWDFEFYAPGSSDLWSVRIDALNGKILEKNNLLLSCSFGPGHDHRHDSDAGAKTFNFSQKAFNAQTSMLEVQGGTYKVIPFNQESPKHSAFQVISNPDNALASPNGWHNTNTVIGGTSSALMYTTTRGNNVWVREDADGVNSTAGVAADGGATLNFNFDYPGESAQPTAYTSAASTNLFYMVNSIHDIWYQYGFNPASANFQQANYGLGGVQGIGDYIIGDSQDGYSQTTPTLNNANFAPSSDGQRPRVQMYLWTSGAPPTEFITINSPAAIAGPRVATTNVFEGTDSIPVPIAPNGITADLVHYTNPANAAGNNPVTIHNGCVAPTNPFDISGKIALIRRGNCNFVDKVKNAQDAGALAAIVYDTVPNNPVRLSMSSEAPLRGITIPAIFVTKEIGEQMVAAMATETVNVKIEVPADLYLFADGDFDNVIIGHEIGHGISNRLIGHGAAGCMTNAEQMGEGWSDWFGLVLQIKPGDQGADPKTIGTYVINEDPVTGAGIRAFPYSTDMTINPRTFAGSNWPVPADPQDTTYRYVVGEFWASVIWDLTWAYINQYGYDANIYTGTGGNNKFMQLMVDAMKMGPVCNTSNMIGFRDIILAADMAATGGANYNMMAEVFRRRGMGLNASSGSATDSNDQTEDFTALPNLATTSFNASNLVSVYPNPSTGVFNIRISQFTGKVNLQVVDMNGRIVFSQTDESFNGEKSINLSGLSKGVYVLKVNNTEFNYSNKIIIK